MTHTEHSPHAELAQTPQPSPKTRARLVRPVELDGPAGRLEALYTPGSPHAEFAAVVCHPHPLFGGTMHNKVVYHAAKVLEECNLPVLRFNFRGAGSSAGTHDGGRGEQDDLRAASGWLRAETGLPLLLAGFSFGAYVALRVACEPSLLACDNTPSSPTTRVPQVPLLRPAYHLSPLGVIALGLPIAAGERSYQYPQLAGCPLPKLFVSGAADAFGPVDAVTAAVSQAAQPSELVFVPEADHFFQHPGGGESRLPAMQAAVRTWLRRTFPRACTQLTEEAAG